MRPLTGASRRFGDLRVRPKLIVLHNLFFLILALGVYLSVVPLIEGRVGQAREREISLIVRALKSATEEVPGEELRPYDLKTGTPDDFGLSSPAFDWLNRNPDQVWRRDDHAEHVYRLVPGSNRVYRLTLPLEFYSGILRSLRWALFSALGAFYLLAVLALELLILPRYVYQPLDVLLAADEAARAGDRKAEIIDQGFIPGDELGQIMRSHNETLTKLREHEDQLEAAKRNLESHDRLASLGLLSASVAHEMNTPLAVLHGSIEKLLETAADEGQRKRLERMHRVSERLRKISAGLLDFARRRPEQRRPVAMLPLVDEAWQLVAIDEKAKLVVFENRARLEDRVMGNPDRLVQVLVNLLRNALMAASPQGARIWVTTSAARIDNRPAVAITVEDNGPGIPAELLPEIFEAFVTSRLDARGTGLGLTVAEGIVTQHGGTISASNRPGGGAKIEFVLPAPDEGNA